MNNLIIGGDLHGHYRALERILDALQERFGVFGRGGPDRLRTDVQLVFTGDYIDRGRHALRIIDRLQRLAHQNPGQVITLLGNHELMALEACDEATELLRRSATGSSRGVVAAYGRISDHGRNGGAEFIREFGGTSLHAVESYVTRMARTGDIGQWMRTLLPAYRTRIAGRGVLFMHADLPERLGHTRDSELTRAVVDAALRRRRPTAGLIFHSDRGSEYLGRAFRARLAAHGVRQSITSGGAPGENAHMESFFHSLKADVIHGRSFQAIADLRQQLRRYVRYYNYQRLHSALEYQSPVDYERRAA